MGGPFFMDIANQAAPTLEVAGELLDELRIASTALGSDRVLLALGNGHRDRQEVAHVERYGLDQDVLVALQPVELTREAVKALAHGRLALVRRIG